VQKSLLPGLLLFHQDYYHRQNYQQMRSSIKALEACYEAFLVDNEKLFNAINLKAGRGYEFSETQVQNFFVNLQKSKVPTNLLEEYELNFLRLPLAPLLRHFDDVVSNVSAHLGKRIYPIEFNCADVKVRPNVVEGLLSSLVHAFRNAVDHGIEMPEDREMLQKDPIGKIKVSATYTQGHDWARMEIQDDGGGIDPDHLKSKALQKIANLDVSKMGPEDILQLVFHPGFSSKESVGQFSGRGVGMDAIKFEVTKLGGKVWIESTFGQGSRLCLEFPVTEVKAQIAKTA
jgi:two-component system chemotaxis sensor kinase CheA